MNTCIYYEHEVVSPDDVQGARHLAGRGAREMVPLDAAWPDDLGDPQPERTLHARSHDFLEELMPRLNRWAKSLEAAIPGVARRHGLSLGEVAKYELLFSLAPAVQRWQALADIDRRWTPDRLLWHTSRPDRELRALCRAARNFPIEVHRSAKRDKPSFESIWHAFKEAVGPPINRARSLARSATRLPRYPRHRADIVFTEYFPNNIAASLPLAERMEAEYGLQVCWLAARRSVADALAARGVESLLLPDVLSASANFRGRLGGSGRREVQQALRALPDELFGVAGTDERDYLLSVLEPRLLAAWNNAAYWIEAYHQVFSVLRPTAVLSTTYSNPMGRASALVAQRFDGRAIYLQHGQFPRCAAYSSFCHDLLLMWGANDFRNLTDFGIDPQAIRVTGPTIYDGLAQRRSGLRAGTLPAGGDLLKIAFMASRTGGMMVSYAQAKTCLLAVATAARQLGQAQLTVKIHPGDHTGMIPDLMRDFPESTVIQSGSSQDIIVDSDLVIVNSSTTGLEACAADKPLIVLDVSGDRDSLPYTRYGAALGVSNARGDLPSELRQAIARLRDDPALAASLAEGRRRLWDDMLNGATDDAAEQAAAAVGEVFSNLGSQPTAYGSRE